MANIPILTALVPDVHLYSLIQTQLRESLKESRSAGATGQGGGQLPSLPFAFGGTRWQPCALCYHYNILYFFLNLFYYSKLKFILPKFGNKNIKILKAKCVMRTIKEPELIVRGRFSFAK